MICKICGQESRAVFRAKVLGRHDAQYFHCPSCRFLQTEEPYWLEQAYSNVINAQDTGLLARNTDLSRRVAVLLFFLFDRKSLFVDYAGGYGVFARLMRDIGFEFYWHDPLCPNLFAKGFEWDPVTGRPVEAVTCFEAFEHFLQPREDLKKILSVSRTVIFSTQLLPADVPEPADWWYYGFNHGQHISFYSLQTLAYLAAQNNLRLYSNHRNLHLLTEKKLSPSKFQLLLKGTNRGLFRFISKRISSRTFDDMTRLDRVP
jgi:hypothetical protein